MSVDPAKFILWPHTWDSANHEAENLEEGVKPSERARDTSATKDWYAAGASMQFGNGNVIPAANNPKGNLIKAGTYQLILRLWIEAGSDQTIYARLTHAGGNYQSATLTPTNTEEADIEFDIVVTSDIDVSAATWQLWIYHSGAAADHLYCRPIHDNCCFGVKAGVGGGAERNDTVLTLSTPAAGTHATPTIIEERQPSFVLAAQYLYPADIVNLNKYTDTLKNVAHSASGVTTLAGTGAGYTTAFTAVCARTVTVPCDATRKLDTTTNTYYVVEALKGAVSLGTVAWELLLNAQKPVLTTLNGAAVGTPVITTTLEPWVEWTDPNSTTTHWRVKVYDTADTLMWDSTETVVGVNRVQIPVASALASLTTYYAVVTVMKGSGGSSWSVDSTKGYFQVDYTATTVKITSHEGTADIPEVITDTTPAFTWTFPKTQHSFNLTVAHADGSVHYNSGWLVSATQGHTVPGGSALDYVNYSVQVQVKDVQQQHVYSSDKRAWLHVNEASIAAPVLTAEADTTTAVAVLLEWAASVVNDSDTLTYEVEVTDPDGTIVTHEAQSEPSHYMGRCVAGTWSWRVRATDSHDLAGTWSAADPFVVTLAGSLPVVTLAPIALGTTIAPRTCWSYIDVDGDQQTDYQVQLDSHAGFGSVEYDDTVESTDLYFQHGDLAVQTWYRRVRVRTGGVDWSAYVDDSFTITAATAQSLNFELFRRHSDGVLSKLYVPISGPSVSMRLDGGPGELKFSMDNFYPFLEDGLLAAHFCDEMTGTVAHDVAGAYPLTLVSTPAWTNGVLNLATADYGYSGNLAGITMAGDWTAVLVVKVTGTTGVFWSIADATADNKQDRLVINGSGKLRMYSKVAAGYFESGDLTVPTASWICLIVRNTSSSITVRRMDTATTITCADKAPTGTPRLALGAQAGTSLDEIVDAAQVALHMLYSRSLTSAEALTLYTACKENLKGRVVVL